MDQRLVAWARAVKSRRRRVGRGCLPTLWLFTDSIRLPDPVAAARRLPKGAAGVVLRHPDTEARAALGAALARICRERSLILVIAGDWRLAYHLRAGLHRPGSRGRLPPRAGRALLTASAHNRTEMARAARSGAAIVFLSPVFPTRSHPGAPALGPVRWSALARLRSGARAGGVAVVALGGVARSNVRRLPRSTCAGLAAIGALATP